jgi:hypothetical protein
MRNPSTTAKPDLKRPRGTDASSFTEKAVVFVPDMRGPPRRGGNTGMFYSSPSAASVTKLGSPSNSLKGHRDV